jgi:hypothetical protein
MLKIADFQFNVSDPIAAFNEQVANTIEGTKGMTQAQAEVWIKAADIAPEVAEMLLKSFVPTLPAGP